MKKTIFSALVLSTMLANAQVSNERYGRTGINTTEPRASFEVRKHDGLPSDRAQGVLFPKFSTAERSLFTNVEVGTMIFNTDQKCIEMYMGVVSGVHQWSCLQSASSSLQQNTGQATVNNKEEFVVSLTHNGVTFQGKINNTTNKLTIKIPYTGGQGSHFGFTGTQTTASGSGQGGDSNQLTLNIPAGNYGVNGELTATITVGGADQEFLVKMLAPGEKLPIATFPVNMNGVLFNVQLVAFGGVPDRRFSESANHKFIYIPIEVTGANGYRKTWLNNNLGAEYAKVGSTHFNPTQQATAHNDYKAYGSLFQWQRPADGHELVTWTSATTGTLSGTTSTLSNNANWTAGHSNFIIGNSSSNWSWVNNTINQDTSKYNLWQVNGANNPCPVGYHVPTKAEWDELHTALGGSNSYAHWANSALKMPAAGERQGTGIGWLYFQGSQGSYWSSTASDTDSSRLFKFDIDNSDEYGTIRSDGLSVRCLKDS